MQILQSNARTIRQLATQPMLTCRDGLDSGASGPWNSVDMRMLESCPCMTKFIFGRDGEEMRGEGDQNIVIKFSQF